METIDPAIIVLFGITGDLAQRKLLPALYHLFKNGRLHESTVILGISRRDVTTEQMLELVASSIKDSEGEVDQSALKAVQKALRMHTMTQTDSDEYRELKGLLDEIEESVGACMHRLFYLSIPPQMFEPIVRNLGEQGLNKGCQHKSAESRLLIEKPFGYDLASAEQLLAQTSAHFEESQIFRIDHYIAKDSVQNIVEFRRASKEVESLWNDNYVSALEIFVTESLDIEGRAGFYEGVGALRDFIQSHLLQVLAVTAMDLPVENTSESVHKSRLALLNHIQPILGAEIDSRTLRGQYEGYREEVDNPESTTETFALIDLTIANERWNDSRVRLYTGKAMAEKLAEVRLTLQDENNHEQSLVIYIQPENGITISGSGMLTDQLQPIVDEFNRSHGPSGLNPLGYERIFTDAIIGDHTLFTTSEEVIAAWKIVDDVVKAWGESGTGLRIYQKGAKELQP